MDSAIFFGLQGWTEKDLIFSLTMLRVFDGQINFWIKVQKFSWAFNYVLKHC